MVAVAQVKKHECPVCGRVVGGAQNLGRHLAKHESDDARGEGAGEFSQDRAPRPREKPKSRPRSAGPSAASFPLAVQLQLPYRLLSNVTASRLPVTSGVLAAQAGPCAEAWDQFLMRYPALREKIEQGMIAGDLVALIMAHLPILAAAREELAARARAMESYEGGVPTPAAA